MISRLYGGLGGELEDFLNMLNLPNCSRRPYDLQFLYTDGSTDHSLSTISIKLQTLTLPHNLLFTISLDFSNSLRIRPTEYLCGRPDVWPSVESSRIGTDPCQIMSRSFLSFFKGLIMDHPPPPPPPPFPLSSWALAHLVDRKIFDGICPQIQRDVR